MSQSRQLAAIMFTDIVGYTAMMGENEQKAFELLRQNRLLQKPIIEEFGGRWIKELGDGIFASFPGVRRGCVYRVVDFPQEKKTRRATGERPATLNRSLVKYPGHGQGELRDSRLEFGTVFCGHLIRTTHGADHRGQR